MADKKKILILGGSGFIGKNLSKYFRDKYRVTATYNKSKPIFEKKIRYLKINLLNEKAVYSAIKGTDIVINAAAVTSGAHDIINRPQIHFINNVIINANAIKAVHENSIKHYIFLSCSVMYHNSKVPLSEKNLNLNRPINEKYFGSAWNKIFAEKSCEFYSKFKKCKYSVIRHSNIYGPYDKFDLKKSHFLGATINKVVNSKSESMNFWGKGTEMRDFLHIDDLLSGIEKMMKSQKKYFDIVNLSYGKSYPIKEIAKKIIKISNKKIKITHDLSKPSISINLSLNNKYALKKYNWKPKVKLEEGLKRTIDWYIKFYNKF